VKAIANAKQSTMLNALLVYGRKRAKIVGPIAGNSTIT